MDGRQPDGDDPPVSQFQVIGAIEGQRVAPAEDPPLVHFELSAPPARAARCIGERPNDSLKDDASPVVEPSCKVFHSTLPSTPYGLSARMEQSGGRRRA